MANPQLMTGIGAALSIFLAAAGSCLASVPAGIFAMRGASGIWAFVPIVISGVLAIYGTIVSVILSARFNGKDGSDLSPEDGYRNLSAGLAVGLACLASGAGMAKFLERYASATKSRQTLAARNDSEAEEPLLALNASGQAFSGGGSFVTFTMVLVFLEAIGLYGLIVALVVMG